jgi:hypothetical protein
MLPGTRWGLQGIARDGLSADAGNTHRSEPSSSTIWAIPWATRRHSGTGAAPSVVAPVKADTAALAALVLRGRHARG